VTLTGLDVWCAGDVIRIHPNVKAVVFPTKHRVVSQGYALIREKSRGLKPEFKGLAGKELGLLKKQGVEVRPLTRPGRELPAAADDDEDEDEDEMRMMIDEEGW
jgi:hypothetical protein